MDARDTTGKIDGVVGKIYHHHIGIQDGTNEIIAIVREALLSEEAVEAADWAAGQTVASEYHDGPGAITAALDTVFGLEPRQEEEE